MGARRPDGPRPAPTVGAGTASARRVAWLAGLAVVVAAVVAGRYLGAEAVLVRALDGIGRLGAGGVVLFALLYVLATVLFLPGWILTVGAGVLFGVVDTRLPDCARAALVDALADAAVVGGRFDARFDNPRPVFRAIARLMNLRSRLTGICTGDQAVFVQRAVFEALGGYREIALMEDVELSRRLKRAGRLACVRLAVTTSARKWEREGVVRTILLMWVIRFLYLCGADPDRLHDWYYGQTRAPRPHPSP